jgi:DNA adenine methylase
MGTIEPVIPWMGGKAKRAKDIARHLWNLAPRHQIYAELCGGAASVLMAKRPSPVEVYNDMNSGLVNFFRVIRDKEQFTVFHRYVALTPFAEEEFEACKADWETTDDPIVRAARWFIVARMSFGGHFGHGFRRGKRSTNGIAEEVNKWLGGVERLPDIHRRLMRVQIEHGDWRTIWDRYAGEADAVLYVDPPYHPETRSGGEYDHEWSVEDHKDLVARAIAAKASVMISGYPHADYEPMERAGFTRIDYDVACDLVGRVPGSDFQGEGGLADQRRIDALWLSPAKDKVEQTSLFELTFSD